MTKEITFKDFNLNEDTFNSISKRGFEKPTEIQEKIIPLIIENKSDIIGIAQTGTGKTAAFGLPIVDKTEEKNKTPKVIILTPTRELALQVTQELNTYTSKKRLNILTIYGGASISNQIKELRRGVDIIVGTPGRVVDMINKNALRLLEVNYFILDEADEMLNMGFIEDIEFILSRTNVKKRVYLFSATIPKAIENLSKKFMKKQIVVEIKHDNKLHTEFIDQYFFKVNKYEKTLALMRIVDNSEFFYGIVFCKMKSDVDKLTRELKRENYEVDRIHSGITQNKREKTLQKFRDMKINILIATDVAARGIDINNLTHVINYSLPQSTGTYVHRIGRTGRAGNKGHAVTLLTPQEMGRLPKLEKLTGFKLRRETLPAANMKKNDRMSQECKRTIVAKKHREFTQQADKLIKEFDSRDLIAALLYKNYNNKKSESPSSANSRRDNRSRDRYRRKDNRRK